MTNDPIITIVFAKDELMDDLVKDDKDKVCWCSIRFKERLTGKDVSYRRVKTKVGGMPVQRLLYLISMSMENNHS